MKLTMLKSKIHRATVSAADLEYEGSIAIDPQLCEAARLHEFEKVDIYNCSNGARISTYVIYGEKGEICLNGAAARHALPGDQVILACYCDVEAEEAAGHKPRLVFVDAKNEIKNLS